MRANFEHGVLAIESANAVYPSTGQRLAGFGTGHWSRDDRIVGTIRVWGSTASATPQNVTTPNPSYLSQKRFICQSTPVSRFKDYIACHILTWCPGETCSSLGDNSRCRWYNGLNVPIVSVIMDRSPRHSRRMSSIN
jgi:hypothetical protein